MASIHKITACRSGTYYAGDWDLDYEITYRYAPAQPLRFYKRNGDPADPPDPELIEFVSVRYEYDKTPSTDPDDIEWATDWLAEHEDDARAQAWSDLDALADAQ